MGVASESAVAPVPCAGTRPSVAVVDPTTISSHAESDSKASRSFRQIACDAAHDSSSVERTNDWDEADVVIVPADIQTFGIRFQLLRSSDLFRSFRTKTVVYSVDDLRWLPLPGLYAACTRFCVRTGWSLPAHYRSDHLPRWDFSPAELAGERDLLFSFVGEYRTHPVRTRLGELRHPRSYVLDASPGERRWWDQSWEAQVPYKERFREYLLRSRFVLCPRGVVANTIRIYEAMEAGAVPVLISDGIALPHGPHWDDFSLRIPERDVASIPAVLESFESRAAEMGAKARSEWGKYFSPTTSFGSLVTWAAEIRHNMENRNLVLPWMWAHIRGQVNSRAVGSCARGLKAIVAGRRR